MRYSSILNAYQTQTFPRETVGREMSSQTTKRGLEVRPGEVGYEPVENNESLPSLACVHKGHGRLRWVFVRSGSRVRSCPRGILRDRPSHRITQLNEQHWDVP